MMGTYGFNLVGRMGTQTGSLLRGFAVLAGRLKVCSVHVTLETCLVSVLARQYAATRSRFARFVRARGDSVFRALMISTPLIYSPPFVFLL
jgi:hypothetical protein